MEALRKLINDEIRSQSRVNVVQTRTFSDRLEAAITRYHNNAITTAGVIQELINLAKDICAAHQRGEEEGLSQEEVSFYDALAQNESAVEVMGNDQLRFIAHELLSSLKSTASVDWQHQESARARMRIWSSAFSASMAIRQTFRMPPCRPSCNRPRFSRRGGPYDSKTGNPS